MQMHILAERVGFKPTAQPGSSIGKPLSITARSRHLSANHYFDDTDIGDQACLEKSCLKSIDQMDCSAWDRGSAVELVPVRVPLNLLSRRNGTSTSAERMAPLSVRSRKAFRLR